MNYKIVEHILSRFFGINGALRKLISVYLSIQLFRRINEKVFCATNKILIAQKLDIKYAC